MNVHKPSPAQKDAKDIVRRILQEESILKIERSTNVLPLYPLQSYQFRMCLTTKEDIIKVWKQWNKNPTEKRLNDAVESTKWYVGTFDRLEVVERFRIPDSDRKLARSSYRNNAKHRSVLKRILNYLKQATTFFETQTETELEHDKIYGTLATPEITAAPTLFVVFVSRRKNEYRENKEFSPLAMYMYLLFFFYFYFLHRTPASREKHVTASKLIDFDFSSFSLIL